MKHFIFLVLFFTIGSCGYSEKSTAGVSVPTGKDFLVDTGTGPCQIYVVEIDSCEYLVSMVGSQWGLMTHKGNCRFCRERGAK